MRIIRGRPIGWGIQCKCDLGEKGGGLCTWRSCREIFGDLWVTRPYGCGCKCVTLCCAVRMCARAFLRDESRLNLPLEKVIPSRQPMIPSSRQEVSPTRCDCVSSQRENGHTALRRLHRPKSENIASLRRGLASSGWGRPRMGQTACLMPLRSVWASHVAEQAQGAGGLGSLR